MAKPKVNMIMIAIVTIEPTSEFLTNAFYWYLLPRNGTVHAGDDNQGRPANAQKHIGSLTHAWDEDIFNGLSGKNAK